MTLKYGTKTEIKHDKGKPIAGMRLDLSKQVKPIGFEAPRGGAYNNRKPLKLETHACRVQSSANNRLCCTHNIQAYFGKFSLIVMFQKF